MSSLINLRSDSNVTSKKNKKIHVARIFMLDPLGQQVFFVKTDGGVMLPEVDVSNMKDGLFSRDYVYPKTQMYITKSIADKHIEVREKTVYIRTFRDGRKFFHYMVCRTKSKKLSDKNSTSWGIIECLPTWIHDAMPGRDSYWLSAALREAGRVLNLPALDKMLETA